MAQKCRQMWCKAGCPASCTEQQSQLWQKVWTKSWAGISQGKCCSVQLQEHFSCTRTGMEASSSSAALHTCLCKSFTLPDRADQCQQTVAMGSISLCLPDFSLLPLCSHPSHLCFSPVLPSCHPYWPSCPHVIFQQYIMWTYLCPNRFHEHFSTLFTLFLCISRALN